MKTEVAEKSNEEKTTVFVSWCTLLFDTGNKSLNYKTFVIIQVIQQTVFINSLFLDLVSSSLTLAFFPQLFYALVRFYISEFIGP